MRATLRFLLLLLLVGAGYSLVRSWPLAMRPVGPAPTPRIVTTVETQVVVITTTPRVRVVQATVEVVAPTPTPRPQLVDVDILLDRYGSTRYPSLDAMPDDLRYFFTVKVNEIGAFFGVRPVDLLALLQARNGGGLRLAAPSEQAGGVAAIPPALWNGWALAPEGEFVTDTRAIEQYGGLGFDWPLREMWRSWTTGRHDGMLLAEGNATPAQFEDGVAALARWLAREGFTAQRAVDEGATFETALAEAIARFDQPPATAQAAPLAAPLAAPSEPLRAAFAERLDQSFGVAPSEATLQAWVDASPLSAEAASGALAPDAAASQLWDQTVQRFRAEGEAARAEGRPLPWPFVHDEASLAGQLLAVELLGHPLAAWELDKLVAEAGAAPDAMRRRLGNRSEARVFAEARALVDEALRRTARGLPLLTHEVSRLVQPALARYGQSVLGERDRQAVLADVEYGLRRLPEYQAIHGLRFFSATPLQPMPRVFKPFGVPARYQTGGVHTGIDLRNPRVGGREPPLYAVEAGTVAHVGPLYCEREDACRGSHAIVLDHGNNVYSIYSHNSAADVQAGDTVQPGQPIGRQGSEGYSMGSHLHFEVHVGAPYTGNWQEPFRGGEFINPMPWLPR